MFMAICPALPIPLVTSLPPFWCTCSTMRLTAFSNWSETGISRMACASLCRISCIFSLKFIFIVDWCETSAINGLHSERRAGAGATGTEFSNLTLPGRILSFAKVINRYEIVGRPGLFFSQVSPLEAAEGLFPLVADGRGYARLDVESYHHRAADAFHLARLGVDDLL